MSLRVQRSEWFLGDLEHYAAWYDREAGWGIAERYLAAVATTLARLAESPTLGHGTNFDTLELSGLRCLQVGKPFQKHLIFYRHDDDAFRGTNCPRRTGPAEATASAPGL